MTVAINPNLTGKRRLKAIRTQQRRIINECLAYSKERLLACIDKLPEEWDALELRWLVCETANQNGPLHDKKKRRLDFNNECLVRNLP